MNKTPFTDRQIQEKQLIIEQLKKVPIVQVSCEKVGVSRATYYRWRKEDADFMKNTDIAIFEGSHLVNDMAESQLLSAIRDKNLTAIIFWLKHHHKAYANRLEISTASPEDQSLTPEQELLVQKALSILHTNEETRTNEKQ